MRLRCFIFCVLLFYNAEGKSRKVQCPEYCVCDVHNDDRRATCQNKKLVSVEIGMPPEVEVLDLSYNQISQLGNGVFSEMNLTDLKHLNLSNNKISQIHMFGFKGVDNLRTLDLSFNIIEYFLDQWFSDLKNLVELYLQGNNLKLINEQPAMNLPSLKVLDLRSCRIEHLNSKIFTSLPNLTVLDISSNYFQHLNPETIRPLTNLKSLFAQDNNLICREKYVSSLKELFHIRGITYVGPCKGIVIRDRNLDARINKNEEIEKLVEVQKKDGGLISEKVGKLERTIITDEDETDKLENIEKYNQFKNDHDAELFEQLEEFVESDQFQKMRMGDTSETNESLDYDISIGGNNYDNSDSTEMMDKLKSIEDIEILRDLKKFIEARTTEKENEVVKKEKNGWWLVDEGEENEEKKLNLKYIENCNGTKQWIHNNSMDKMLMEFIEMFPSLSMLLSALFGLMLGLIIGCTAEIENFKKINLPKFNRKRRNGNEKDADEHEKEPIVDDGITIQVDDPLQSKITLEENSEDDAETLRPSSGSRRSSSSRSPKRAQSPFEDQSLLLDNEQKLEDSTPVLGKKKFPWKD